MYVYDLKKSGFVSRGSPCAYAHRDAWQDDEDGYGTPDDGSGSANRTAARFIGHEEHGHEPVARPVPAPTRGFVLAARTLKPHSLPGQPRVTLSLRKEHFKSSLRAVPGGKEPNMRPKTRSS